MRIRTITSLLGMYFFSYHAMAQSDYIVKLPQVLPASPEATAFMKAGVGNANLSTGAASANITLYDLKLRDYSLPISLGYSFQGLKADEFTSRVGVGWTLNAGGVVTRVVKGKPDEYAARLRPPADFSANTAAVYNYESDAASPTVGGDTQADEFQFNVNGLSGKFVLDTNYIPRVTSTSNVKITVQITVTPGSTSGSIGLITLTNSDGVKYSFGTAYEKTAYHNILEYDAYKNVTKTSFFLDNITLPTGEFINFAYSPIYIKVITGKTQTLQIPRVQGPQDCGNCLPFNTYTTREDKVEYNTNYLTGISVSDGREISLGYEARGDSSHDKRLKTFEVEGLKSYVFDYYSVPHSGVVNGRFFLTKIRDLKNVRGETNPDSSYNHEFSYYSMDQVPLPITYAQDYLGYYNGQTSNNCLVPPTLNQWGSIDWSFRDPSSWYAQQGGLSMIRYPTGGTEEFIYEGNTQLKRIRRNTLVTESISGPGDVAGGGWKVYNTYFTLPFAQSVKLNSYCLDADPNDSHVADSTHNTSIWRIYDGATLVSSRSTLGYKIDSTVVNLLGSHNYRLELTVKDPYVIGFAGATYDTSDHAIYDTINAEIPGVRLARLKYTDPVSQNTHSKYYTYASLEQLNKSTGGVYGDVAYRSSGFKRTYCLSGLLLMKTECSLDITSSSSSELIYNLAGSGSLIYYSKVIESDDPNFVNGGTEYSFFPNENGGNSQTLWGEAPSYLATGQYPTLSGKVERTRVFDSNKQIVKEETNSYQTLIDLSNSVASIYVRKNFDTNSTYLDWMEGAFDVVRILYGNYWIRLVSKTEKTFAKGVTLTNTTNYTYGTAANVNPVTVTSTDSKGKEVKTENSYATDFASTPGYAQMITQNLVDPVVRQTSYRNGVLLQQKQILYKDWFSDGQFVLPEIVKLKESPGGSLKSELVYGKMNYKGSFQSVNKPNDLNLVYLWDSVRAVPVCEARNANFDQVAYCGFEPGTEFGNWTVSSGSVNTTGAFTGSKGFSGTLTKAISKAGNYVVTLWAKTAPTVNSASGIVIRSTRGWTLYKWTITNPSTVTVVGTNVDDVRLHPENAELSTFNYIPFVGISSRSDVANTPVYYEYDGDNRLLRIRDVDRNVIKQFDYQYQVFGNAVAQWQSQGQTRCKPCPANAAYVVNMQQHLEKDINPQSVTYNTTRWQDDGIAGLCVITPDWQNFGSPSCQLNGAVNTGYLVTPQKDMNPCSPTYNTTQNITVYNTTACPLSCNAGNCSGNNKKCVNGICETGTRVNVSSIYMKINNPNGGSPAQIWIWRCTYHYVFSDCSVSADFTEDNANPCTVGGGCQES